MPATKNTYISEKENYYTMKIRDIMRELPDFCGSFFRNAANYTSVLTRYAYAVDLRTFFAYAVRKEGIFSERDIPSLTVADLAKIKREHIEEFLDDVTLYSKDDRELSNKENAKARKLSTLRAFFKYYFKHEQIPSNVAALVDAPKLHQKAIIRMEPNEVADLLDKAESGSVLTSHQKKYHQYTGTRDTAILTLFLGTGIRISELVGLDIGDIDFENSAFLITRKGGSQEVLNFGDEVYKALFDYREYRLQQIPMEGHENALFLSMQMRRMTVRSVENLVKKYAAFATPKKITPHKLRSTFGTTLYQESGDIYLVADVLGHKDVNTTKKHYAKPAEDGKRLAAKLIKLRDD